APNGPVALPNARGSEKMPAPTIDPTTIEVRANSESFSVRSDTAGGAAAGTSTKTVGFPLEFPAQPERSPADWARCPALRSFFGCGRILTDAAAIVLGR